MRPLLISSGCLIAGLLSMPGPAPATDVAEERPAQTALLERATAELVLIEVYVTDSRGRPVRDLTADDFVLKVERRRKPIASVEYYEPPPSPPEGRSRAAAAADEAAPAGPSAPLYPRRLVLFFEDAVSDPFALGAARRAAIEFLEADLLPDDLVSILAYNRLQKLRVLHDFSTDRESLRRVIEESLDDRIRFSDHHEVAEERRREIARALQEGLIRRSGSLRDSDAPRVRRTQAASLATAFAKEDAAVMGPILSVLRSLVDALAAWPGQRGIVYIGDGIPEYPTREYHELGDDSFNLSVNLKGLARAAATAGVTLHAIQTTGVSTGGAGRLARDFQRQNSLKILALNTGGVVSTTNEFLGGLQSIDRTSRSYYVLAYAPEGPPDGIYHGVTVKVKRGGVRVRHRDGFVRLPPEEARERSVQAAHLLPELHPRAGLEMAAVPGPPSGRERVYDLVVYLPARSAAFVPEKGRWTSRVELGLVSMDATGKKVYRTARNIRIMLPPGGSPAIGLGLNLFARVPLPARRQTITAVFSDLQGGILGAASIEVEPSGAAAGDLAGLSIYSMAQKSLWIDLDTLSEDGDGDEPIETYESGPALRTRFAPGEPIACGFRLPAGRPPGKRWDLVILRGDEVVRSKPIGAFDGPTPGPIRVALPVEGLADGDYVLLVRERTANGGREHGRLPFRIDPGASADLR